MRIDASKRQAVLACLGLLGLADTPSAQTTDPSATVALLVGYAPGGLADHLARLAAKYLQREIDQTVVVQNVPGAGGMRAVQWLAAMNKQTTGIMLADTSLFIEHLAMPPKGLTTTTLPLIGGIGDSAFVVAVSANAPWQTLADLMLALRQQPGRYDFGIPGMNTLHQLTVDWWMMRASAKVQPIPYQGGAQMLPDLITQRIAFGMLSTSLALEQAAARRLRLLAVTSPQRLPELPEVPTLAERYPDVCSVSTAYLLAAPAMPPETLQRLRTAWQRAIADPTLKQALTALQMIPDVLNAPQAQERRGQEVRQWTQVLAELERAPAWFP